MAPTGSYLNASLAPLSLTFDEMSNGCFFHIQILFRLRESYTFTNINWIIKRAINLNPTCVDKIMVMEACFHFSTSYLPRNLGILRFWHHERSSLACASPVLGYIYDTYSLQSDVDYTAKICGCTNT